MFIWPYASRGATKRSQESIETNAPAEMDFNAFSSNDAFIKVWLPERIEIVLDTLSAAHNVSRPDALRAVLFQHVYGVFVYEQFLDWKRKKDEREQTYYQSAPPEPDAVLFSRSRTTMDMLGKSTSNLKFWLPMQLKEDLTAIATVNELGISDYVRLTLAKRLIGEKFIADWQQSLQDLPEDVKVEENNS